MKKKKKGGQKQNFESRKVHQLVFSKRKGGR